MNKTITHKVFYPHPPADVWDYLTKPELIAEWLMQTDFEPVVGRSFQFKTRAMPNFNFDGNIFCKVLEAEPFRKLSYSWKGGPGDGTFNLDSLVVWTLEEKDGGTELSLKHTGFDLVNDMMYTLMNQGWLSNMNKIGGLINTRKYGQTNA